MRWRWICIGLVLAGLVGVVDVRVRAQRRIPQSEINLPVELAPGVWFRQGDLQHSGHCNNGWVVFDDFVLVIDANFPSGAEACLADIRKTTNRPVRYVFDTHHHGDHAYGNAVWADQGAILVSHENCRRELLQRGPEGFAGSARRRPDVASSRLQLPSVVFPDRLIFDDRRMRVGLLYHGHGHTSGDAVAYLPKQRILFTGDACVNGPYNFLGDSNLESWIRLLGELQRLDARIVAPGHGPVGNGRMLEEQRAYFVELRRQVYALARAGKSLEEVRQAVSIPRYEKWAGVPPPAAHIDFVYRDATRK